MMLQSPAQIEVWIASMAKERSARVGLIGDVGGHLGALTKALVDLGVDVAAAVVPDDLTIVQVGDLIHRGPDSAGVVALVDRFLQRDPARWVQLVGNHESQLLPGGTSFFPEPQTDAACGATVRGWWRNGLLRVAYAFESAGVAVGQPGGRGVATVGAGGVLVTHAGLSCGAWRILGAPPDAAGVVARLDADKAELPLIVWREGSVITGAHDAAAGPLWASAAESVASWVEAGVVPPFSQVFGHSAIFRWEPGERPRWDPEIAKLLESGALTGAVDEGARHVRLQFAARDGARGAGPTVWAIDPGHGVDGAARWAPLLLPRV